MVCLACFGLHSIPSFCSFYGICERKSIISLKMCVIAGSGARLRTAKRVKGFLELSDVSVGEFEQAFSTRVTSIYSGDTDTHGLLVESSVKLHLG